MGVAVGARRESSREGVLRTRGLRRRARHQDVRDRRHANRRGPLLARATVAGPFRPCRPPRNAPHTFGPFLPAFDADIVLVSTPIADTSRPIHIEPEAHHAIRISW